jgi:hypothetical protein
MTIMNVNHHALLQEDVPATTPPPTIGDVSAQQSVLQQLPAAHDQKVIPVVETECSPDILQLALQAEATGFDVILLRGKRPKGEGWTEKPRKDARQLQANFTLGDNYGIRTGRPSTRFL